MSSRAARLNKLEGQNTNESRHRVILVLDGQTFGEALAAYKLENAATHAVHPSDTLHYVTEAEFSSIMKQDCHHGPGEECESDDLVAEIIGGRRAARGGVAYQRPSDRDDCLGFGEERQRRFHAKACGRY